MIRDDSKLIPITYLDNFGLAMRETLMLKLTPYQMALLDTHMPYKKSFHIHFNHKHQIQCYEDRFLRPFNLFCLRFKGSIGTPRCAWLRTRATLKENESIALYSQFILFDFDIDSSFTLKKNIYPFYKHFYLPFLSLSFSFVPDKK